MYTVVWRFKVRPDRRAEFEKMYGAGGEWAALFRQGRGYIGTELFQNVAGADEYITVDRWQSRDDFMAFKREHADAYQRLDRVGEELTVSETRLADFED